MLLLPTAHYMHFLHQYPKVSSGGSVYDISIKDFSLEYPVFLVVRFFFLFHDGIYIIYLFKFMQTEIDIIRRNVHCGQKILLQYLQPLEKKLDLRKVTISCTHFSY